MAKRKVCKRCKLFTDEQVCPVCKSNVFSTNWQGRLFIVDPSKSFIAKQISIDDKGEYAIKVR